MNNTILEVINLSKSFKGHLVVDNINFKIYSGDVFGFLGPNGSGKTTTIRMILSLIKPDSGKVYISGYDIKDDFINSIKKVGAIIEEPKFHTYLTGEENLNLMAKISNIPKSKVLNVIELVGLTSSKDKKFIHYSLGMKQRLGIANALLANPMLIILDEPTNGLDPHGIKEIRELIIKLSSENGITFLVSTHLLYEVEQICNRVAILNKGKIIKEGSVDSLIVSTSEDVVLHTSLINEAINIISNTEYVNSFKRLSSEIFINLSKGHTAKLVNTLVTSGIDVKYIIPMKTSLEDVFINLTTGDSNND